MANNDGNNNFAMLAMVAIVAVVGVFGLVFMNSGNQGTVMMPSDSADGNTAGEGYRSLSFAASSAGGGSEKCGVDYDGCSSGRCHCPNGMSDYNANNCNCE